MQPILKPPTAPPPLRAPGPQRRAQWKSLAWLAGSLVVLLWATGGISQSGSSAFRLVGLWPGYLRGDVTCVATDGRHAYVGLTLAGPGGCERGWRGRLEVLDVSDPARPVWVSGLNFRDPIRRIQVASNHVYVAANRTLQVLSVTNPSLPVLLGKWQANDEIKSFQLKDACLYVLRNNALDVLDVTNPAQPVLVSSRGDFWGGAGIQVADHFAYVAAGGGLRIFDVGNSSQPILVGSTSK